MPGKELVPRPAVQPPDVLHPPWERRVRREASPTAWQWLYRRRHWTLPVALLPAMTAAAEILHVSGQSSRALIAGGVLTVVVAFFGHLKWNRMPEHMYATFTAAGATVWLFNAGWYGPLATGWLGLPWFLITLAAGLTGWGIPWYAHKRPRGQRKRQKRIGRWDEWWQSHCWHWNLGGSKVIDVWEMGLTTKIRVQGIAGRHSIQHVNQVMPLIESGLDGFADIGMVRAEPVKGHPNWFDFYLKKENPLAVIAQYDPALAPLSVTEPIPAGITETGAVKTISGRVNNFVIGMTRWGKSNLISVKLAAYTGCRDDRTILIDIGGGRSSRPWLPALDYVATGIDEARQVLRFLNAEVQARRKGAYFGEEQLTPTAEVPAFHLLIDETHAVTSVPNGDAECARLLALIASQGNAVAVYTEVYTQHGSLEESVRTEQTRANLPLRIVFRVAEARHGAYAIPEYGKLDASKLEEKGTCYIKDGPRALPEQVRTYLIGHDLVRKIASQEHHSALSRPPLLLYAEDWQEWWDTRWSRLDPVFQADCPQYQVLAAASPAEAFAAQPPPPPPGPAAVPGEGSGAAVAARIAAELDGVPDAAPPRVNLGPVIRTQEERFAAALEAAGAGISPAQLMGESGRGSSWVHEKLKALVELGAVTQAGRGLYVAVPGADVAAALGMIKDRGDRLYREARAMVDVA